MKFHPLLFLIPLAGAAPAGRAQTTPPPDTTLPPKGQAEVLSPVVVSDHLDQAREDIVPALGATQFSITPAQIDVQPLGGDAGFNQILLRAPGVAQDSYGQLHLRGEHGDLQYRINDVLLPEGISGFGQELDPRFVRSLNLLTGALPAQYGFRTAGIVDIHTQTGASLPAGGSATLFGGSYGSARADFEGSGSRGGWSGFATASLLSNDIGIESPTPGTDPIHDRTEQAKFFADAVDTLGDSRRLSVMASGSFATFQIPDRPGLAPAFTLAGVPRFNSAGLNENQREDNAYAIVSYQQAGPSVSGQLSAFARYSLVKFLPDPAGDLIFNGVASRVHQDLGSDGLEGDFKWDAGESDTVRFGALLTAENANTRTSDLVFPADAAGEQTSPVPLAIAEASHRLGWLYGAYVQDEWKPLLGLTVNYGFRADGSQGYRNEGQLSPRLNVSYKLTGSTGLHAGYARYFTPPPLELVAPADLARFAGTTNAPEVTADSPVRSERADYFDAGISQQFGSDFSVTLDAYDKEATNQLDEGQFGAALVYAPFNYRLGRIRGAELAANYTHRGFSAYANLARSRAEGRDVVSGQYQFEAAELAYIADHWVRLDHDQTVTASAGVSDRFGEGSLVYLDLLYGSGLRDGFANTGHLPAYHPLNLGFEQTFKLGASRELKARLDLENVLDEAYELRDGSGIGVFAPQFGQRRGLYGSLTWTF